MTTIERVIALQRVPLFADVPGRVARRGRPRASEHEVAAGAPVIVQGAVEDHLFAIVEGRLRVHDGEHDLATLGAGRDRGRAGRAGAGAALRVRDRARALGPAPDRQARAG